MRTRVPAPGRGRAVSYRDRPHGPVPAWPTSGGNWQDLGLARWLNTIAIRDQMVRAEMLGDRLPGWLEQVLGPTFKDWPILVIGGGACGLTAAVALARQHQELRIDVVETRDIPFYIQANCESRWIDPTQYDWPMAHWDRGRHQWDGAFLRDIPFPWFADRSHRIVRKQWVPRLGQLLSRLPGQITFLPRTRTELQTLIRLRAATGRSAGLLESRPRDLQTHTPSGIESTPQSCLRQVSVLNIAPSTIARISPGSPSGIPIISSRLRVVSLAVTHSREPFSSQAPGTGATGLPSDCHTAAFGERDLPAAGTWGDRLRSGEHPFGRVGGTQWRDELGSRAAFVAPYVRDLHRVHEAQVNAILTPALRQQVMALAADRPTKTILVSRQGIFSCTVRD